MARRKSKKDAGEEKEFSPRPFQRKKTEPASDTSNKSTKKVKKTKIEKPSKSPKTVAKKRVKKPAEKESPEDEYVRQLRKQQKHMPLVDHLGEIRGRLARSILWLLGFSALGFVFYDEVWYFVMAPLENLVVSAKEKNLPIKFITTELTDYFMLKIKLTLTAGLLFAAPAISLEILKFVMPALDKKKWKWGYVLLFASVILFWSGIMLARNYVWPLATDMLVFGMRIPELPIENGIAPELHLTLKEYFSIFTSFHFAFGLTFQLPIISVILGLFGMIKSSFFIKNWRSAIVVIAVFSAFMTPPDPFTMGFMMVPLLLLYFLSAILVRLVERKEKLD
ncbi:MAG: twin-arginine translocase subunit TatC [Leptospirales bacterium]